MTGMRILPVLPLLAVLALPAAGFTQALPNVNLTRVLYNTRKATVKPEGELKVQVEAVDAAIAEATRLGQTGEVRRQVARGLTLLDGRAWTPALDFQHSLVLRAERTSSMPPRRTPCGSSRSTVRRSSSRPRCRSRCGCAGAPRPPARPCSRRCANWEASTA